MSDTPETDRFDPRCGRDASKDDALTEQFGIVTVSGPDYERLLEHARKLERERDKAHGDAFDHAGAHPE